MSQSTPFLVSNPVFHPSLLDIPFLDTILASSSTAVVAGRELTPHDNAFDWFTPLTSPPVPTSIQHHADIAFRGTNGDCQPSPPIPVVPPPPVHAVPPPSHPLPAVLPPPPPPPPHIYHRINTTLQHHIAATIESLSLNGKKSHKCVWPNCPFITHSKPTALIHARKHFGNPKFYACSCGVRFVCKDSAQRHCDTRNRVFECALCAKKFARRDYRLVHQRRCPA